MVAVFAFTGCKKSTPSDYVNKLYSAMKDKDYKAVVDMMPGMDTLSEEDKQGTIEMMQLFDGFSGGVTDYKILSEDISDDGKSAVVHVQVTYGTGEVEDDVCKLVKGSKGWAPAMPDPDEISDDMLDEFDLDDYAAEADATSGATEEADAE